MNSIVRVMFGAAVVSSSLARAADDRWAVAKEALASMTWATAASEYHALRADAKPGSPEWTQATFAEGVARQHVQPASAATIDEAAKLFQAVIDHATDDRYVARALLNLGRIAELIDYPEDVADFTRARQAYEQVMRRWPDEPIGSEAALRAGATDVMAYDAPGFERVRAGIALIEKWLGDHPNNPYANVMWQYAGDSYFRPLADYAAAIRCYDRVERIGWADDGNQGAWYWRCGQIADRYLNDRKTAIHYYTAVITKTPSGGQAYAAMQELKRLGAPRPAAPFLDDPAGGGKTR